MKPTTSLVAAAVLTAAAVATAPAQSHSPNDAAPAVMELYVDNQNAQDVQVFAETDSGQRELIGRVMGLSGRTLEIPAAFTGQGEDFRIRIKAVGDNRTTPLSDNVTAEVKTNPIPVEAGRRLALVVRDPLTQTYIQK